FMLAVKGQFQPSHWKESRVSFSFSEELSKFASLGSNTRKPFHQHLRSLIMTNGSGFPARILFNKCSKLRLLKVLDLSSYCLVDLWSNTLKPLIHLKYLAVYTDEFDFHPELHLPHLETLIVQVLSGHTLLFENFGKMEKLRRVEIYDAVLELAVDKEWWIFEESSKLENLRIFKGITLVMLILWMCYYGGVLIFKNLTSLLRRRTMKNLQKYVSSWIVLPSFKYFAFPLAMA
ncbi:hypothetical protein HAX54_048113, partial [Datura stramonium]|nr:hypothetical protein [Datura stramonium]